MPASQTWDTFPPSLVLSTYSMGTPLGSLLLGSLGLSATNKVMVGDLHLRCKKINCRLQFCRGGPSAVAISEMFSKGLFCVYGDANSSGAGSCLFPDQQMKLL